MSTASGHRHWLLRLLVAPLLFAAPGPGSSHSGMNAVETGRPGPGNAYAADSAFSLGYSGNEWRCVEGFRKQGAACTPERL
jgi:hypothetical protein